MKAEDTFLTSLSQSKYDSKIVALSKTWNLLRTLNSYVFAVEKLLKKHTSSLVIGRYRSFFVFASIVLGFIGFLYNYD